jgi:hypothetical protein
MNGIAPVPGNFIYPTRNFARCCYPTRRVRWPFSPACRHADRTLSSPIVTGVWRKVSEDFDQLSPGLLAIHRLNAIQNAGKSLM